MRRWIANNLVWLARKIDKPNDEAMKFIVDRMMEFAITGQGAIKISAVDMRDAASSEDKP